MIESLTVFLMCIIGACAATQPSKERRIIAFLFAFTLLSHLWFFHTLSDNIPAYYITAGILDFLVIQIIGNMITSSRLANDIMDISIVSLVFNFIGFWTITDEPQNYYYMSLYLFLYGWAIYVLIRGEPHGDTKASPRFLSIRPNVYFRSINNHFKEKERCHTNTQQPQ